MKVGQKILFQSRSSRVVVQQIRERKEAVDSGEALAFCFWVVRNFWGIGIGIQCSGCWRHWDRFLFAGHRGAAAIRRCSIVKNNGQPSRGGEMFARFVYFTCWHYNINTTQCNNSFFIRIAPHGIASYYCIPYRALTSTFLALMHLFYHHWSRSYTK